MLFCIFLKNGWANRKSKVCQAYKSHVSTETDAIELLEAINDVLTWFCFDQPEARFCRTVVLSGFTLNSLDQSEPVVEANKRFDAMVSLGKNGMLGSYQHDSKHSKMDITECSNTYLLIQTYPPARDEIVQVDEDLSESCVARGACWKSMRFVSIFESSKFSDRHRI